MTAQETNLFNAFETTLTATMGSSDTTLTVASVTDSYPTTLSAPFYIVINPDSATNREVILVTAVDTGTKQLTTTILNRYLQGSAASSGLSHSSGQVVRMAPLQQHIEDLNDRVDTVINEAGTAVNTSLFLDEDDMVSDSATKGVTQQSVKAYVDSQVTAQDLDFLGDSGSGAVDLDSQDFTIAGTANEIETSASGQTLTIGLPSSITVNVTGDLTGNVSGDLTGNVTATSVLADGVTATTQSAGDNSTKVATTAYVDALSVDDNLTVSDGTTSTTIDLDTQTFSVLGTANEIETSTTAQTITIGLPANITVNVTGQVSDISNHSTTDLSEGTNLYYTTARFDTAFSGKSTTDLSEGTNLYYTTTRANTDIDARVDKAFVDALNVDADTLDGIDSTGFATAAQGLLADSAVQPSDNISTLTNDSNFIDLTDISVTDSGGDGSLAYNNATGVITYTGPSQAEVLAHISAGTGITISGTGAIATTITQYADSDVQSYLSGGTGVTLSGAGEFSIGQAVATTDNVTFNNVTVDGVLNSNDITAANISIDGNATITGNLTVEGTTTQVDSTTVTVADPLFKYAKDNTGNSVDIGFYGKYVQSATTKYAGLAWDASQSDKFRLFHGLQTEPTTTVDITATGHTVGTLIANLKGDVTGNADTATALASGQNFSLTGDVTASAISFDGSGAVALATTVTESAVTQHQAALSITESQISDLQSYLTAETNDLSSVVTWANVPDANITQSSVTQHQAALSITESQISDLQSYLTAETNDLSSVVTWANVPDANITESSVTQHEAA